LSDLVDNGWEAGAGSRNTKGVSHTIGMYMCLYNMSRG
jgi:hypothetical protein